MGNPSRRIRLTCTMSARSENWRYEELVGFARFEGVPSPPFVAADPSSPLLEYASFLEPLSNFSLDDDEPQSPAHSRPLPLSPSSAPCGATLSPEQTGKSRVSPLGPLPLSRQLSQDVQLIVQSSCDEMDDVLAQKASERKLSACAAIFTPEETSSAPVTMELEPTVEEQAWLERQCEAMERCNEIEAEAEAEERFVQRMLSQHPTLSADEARQLFDVDYPSSPEPLASPSWAHAQS